MKRIDWNALNEPTATLYEKGRSALSDSELLSIIAQIEVPLAQRIFADCNYQISELARMGASNLLKYEGMGIAKASAIISALELGRRRKMEPPVKKVIVHSSASVFHYFKPFLQDEVVEHFYILLMKRNNEIMRHIKISSGGTSGTVADPKLIFKHALDHLASSIILVHNHPSGNLKPSEQDRRLTTRLKEVGKFLEVPVLDHVIFTDIAYFSFADEGLI
ncbi:JAB domain-containing protein [Mongoliibacter ruber]|nr:DNA repair protein RadC [Mongoliibacter ruber]